ncbi:MAG: hypothetical protein A2131_00365 [Candidatus Sungbacteria bacterium GWC2_49_10]|uniref:Uncharacterized protein n=1 Tax=Candidatus Sungbacteria bacterium GWC2_49_10 TaxID=1802263 RepID=A0A1G2K2N7_9BACT|nr:MAG: hypothetical protein A2131_00365 [Candidatus Sungbacteria bacterium GWC2_49_10]
MTVMEGAIEPEPTVTFAVAVRTVPDDDLYAALMSAVPFEFPFTATPLNGLHPGVKQSPIATVVIEVMPGLLDVHSAATGIRAGIT